MKPTAKSQTQWTQERLASRELERVQAAKETLWSLQQQLELLASKQGRASSDAAEAQLGIIRNLLADCEAHRKAALELWLESLATSGGE